MTIAREQIQLRAGRRNSSRCERPVHCCPRRLVDGLNPTGAKKVHSLIDKVYQRQNLEMAWERVRANRGSGGVDGQSLSEFAEQVDQQLDRLQGELRGQAYRPQPVRQVAIPKVGQPGVYRTLGIPSIYDRVCQQALLNRLEPIFEPVFDDANFGYRLCSGLMLMVLWDQRVALNLRNLLKPALQGFPVLRQHEV